MSNLFNKLRETTDSGAVAGTTSSDIAFSPQMLGVVEPVPMMTDQHLRAKKRKKKIKEDIDYKVAETRVAIVEEIKKVVLNSKLTYEQYVKAYGYKKDLTPSNMLINVMKRDQSLKGLESRLGEDVGELGLILNDIRSGKPLTKYEMFKNFNYLLGCRLQSIPVRTITLIYEGFMDQDRVERESLMISDLQLVDVLKKRGFKNQIEDNGKWGRIFPVDRYFDTNFYTLLTEVFHSDFEAEDEAEEGSEEEQNLDDGNTNDFNGGEDEQSKEEIE